VLALSFHGHLRLLAPTPSSHSSGRGFGPAPVEWDLAIVDPLLIAGLDDKSLLGSSGRLVVALIRIVVAVALDRRLLRVRRERPCRRAA
jgi:hypothetical protein